MNDARFVITAQIGFGKSFLESLIEACCLFTDSAYENLFSNSLILVGSWMRFDSIVEKNPERERDLMCVLKKYIDELYVQTWDTLHLGDINLISEREVYTFVCFIEAFLYASYKAMNNLEDPLLKRFYSNQALYFCDIGLIIGGSKTVFSILLQKLAQWLKEEIEQCFHQSFPRIPLVEQANLERVLYPQSVLEVENHKNVLYDVCIADKPAVIRDYAQEWPAVRRWVGFRRLRELAGVRTVPVEIGSDYLQTNWTQKLMTVDSFIDNFIENDKPPAVGYVAQHEFFVQVPTLLQDISIPAIFSDDETDSYSKMFWFGPSNTVTPLHTDPYDNLFIQVVGSKYWRLYNPEESYKLYKIEKGLLTNNSGLPVDITTEHVDESQYPLFKDAKFAETVLNPGDLLFIPRGWWHFVKSLTASVSVSFWFDGSTIVRADES